MSFNPLYRAVFSLHEPDTVTYALILCCCEHLCLNTGVYVMQEVECLTAESFVHGKALQIF